ncbi:porphobilinogen synthase [Candidatus Omnitrophota bacterium]
MLRAKKEKPKRYNISVDELIYPLFVKPGRGLQEEIPSMPGVFRFSPDTLVKEVSKLERAGLRRFLVFGVPDEKDWQGSGACREDNIVAESVYSLKIHFSNISIITDVCLCAYTSHGHCGVIVKQQNTIDRIATLKSLSNMALSHARAGADFVAPSAMAKNQVKAIRSTLDKNGYAQTKILGYSAKFASNFYGPFRAVANSAPKSGDRRGYQLDYTKRESALDRVKQDIKEGADIVMVKPSLAYLDIVRDVKNRFNHPLAVYNVSGEYASVKNGAKNGFWDEREIVFEIISSIKRAGADFIITYHAKDIAGWLKKERR